jgi:hypothetical protein
MGQISFSPSEDKIIIAVRQWLEGHWLNGLTSTQRTAWTTLFASKPPQDITGRQYITGTPATMLQTKVLPQTQYAWSQIYGVYRFFNVQRDAPASTTTTTPLITPIDFSGSRVWVETQFAPFQATQRQFIIFFTQSSGPLLGDGLARLRPIGWANAPFTPAGWDVGAGYTYRFGPKLPGQVVLTMATVDENNMLNPSPFVTTTVFT